MPPVGVSPLSQGNKVPLGWFPCDEFTGGLQLAEQPCVQGRGAPQRRNHHTFIKFICFFFFKL